MQVILLTSVRLLFKFEKFCRQNIIELRSSYIWVLYQHARVKVTKRVTSTTYYTQGR